MGLIPGAPAAYGFGRCIDKQAAKTAAAVGLAAGSRRKSALMRASRTRGFYRFGDVVIGPSSRPKISSTSSPEAVIIRMVWRRIAALPLQTSKPFFRQHYIQYHQNRPLLGNARYGEGAGGGRQGLRGSCVGLGNRKSTPPGRYRPDHRMCSCVVIYRLAGVGMNRGA